MNTDARARLFTMAPMNPKRNKSVAIIGAGWSGLQTAKCLLDEMPDLKIDIYERLDDVGGTWHPTLAYHGLQLHAPVWLTEFEDFPYTDQSRYYDKIGAVEVREYIAAFCDKFDLRHRINFRKVVTAVRYNSKDQQALLDIEDLDSDTTTAAGPYDTVVFATLAADNKAPLLPGADVFRGMVLHSSMVKENVFREIVQNEQKVVVIGGSKSAADQVISLQRAGHDEVTLLHRRLYWFLNYERVLGDPKSVFGKIHGILVLMGILTARFSGSLACFFLWSIGAISNPGPLHFDFRRFHFGVLDRKQLAAMDQVKKIEGEPESLVPTGLQLSDGRTLEADVVIFATGYGTGLEDIHVETDGLKVDMQEGLYEHLLVPGAPIVAMAASAFYTFGIKRGVTLAAVVAHRLRTGPPTAEEIDKSVRRNTHRSDPTRFAGFISDANFTSELLGMNLDFIRVGLLSPIEFLRHWADIFVFQRQRALRLKLS